MPSPIKPKTEIKPEEAKDILTPSFVTAEEFNTFKDQQNSNTNAILDAISALKPEPSRAVSVIQKSENAKTNSEQASARSANYILNPAHQAILDDYFDPRDGFEGRLETLQFSIIVPKAFWNSDQAYQDYYKTDIRMKVLNQHDMEKGMKDWCALVVQNLKYKKRDART